MHVLIKNNKFPEHVKRWNESCHSMAVYCKEQGLNYQTFTYLVFRIRKKETGTASANDFAHIKASEKLIVGIEYHFSHGGYFVFPEGCFINLIKSLIPRIKFKPH